MKRTVWVFVVGLFVVGATVILQWNADPIVAQNNPANVQGILTQLQSDETLFTIEFMQTVPRVGKSVDIGAANEFTIDTIGADVICFELPANTSVQVTCTPYSNVAAILYSR